MLIFLHMNHLLRNLFVGLFCLHFLHFPNSNAEDVKKNERHLDEPERVIHSGDLMRLTLRLPGKSFGALNKVEKNGEVATPDGSFIKADKLDLETFRSNFVNLYKGIHGYEEVQIEAYISSSPFTVIKYPNRKAPDLTSTNLPPPTVYPRNFKVPTTIWTVIQDEGGVPPGVSASKIQLLKRDLSRKTFDCHESNGNPDGKTLIESGDYLFLVPEKAPVSQIFEK
jgi:hypothetical protein